MQSDFYNDTVTIKGKEIPVQIGFLPQQDLKFYPENPRIYSFICQEDKEPSQQEIFEKLSTMDHVRELVQSIKANGGLREPVIVRNFMVLEGNSRLAAYRILVPKDPIQWGKIKCKILPDDVGDDIAFAILADHITGKKDWAPYEQAGYLYRRHSVHKIPIKQIADDMSLSQKRVNHYIYVYSFMLDHGERNVDRWSFYDEYLKGRTINKSREDYPNLDDTIVSKIKSGEIPKAVDLRDKLKIILTASKSIKTKFISGSKSFDQCFSMACDQGNSDGYYKKLHAFRNWIVDRDVEKSIKNLGQSLQQKCTFELTKIHSSTERMLKKLKKSTT